MWWARRDSNPQALFRQRILSPSRIPIPPLAQILETALFYRYLQHKSTPGLQILFVLRLPYEKMHKM